MLAVHLDGYLNVLGAALPIMAAAGHGRILGVTSGSGWRPADAGAYGCAKRAVAALTWQLGRQAPPGRRRQRHVADRRDPDGHRRARPAAGQPRARRRARRRPAGSRSARCPTPEQLGPFGAHLVGEDFSWCSGQVIFAGGSEVAVIDEPRLLEVVRTDDVTSLPHVLEAVAAGALAPAEAEQASSGGSNPRFGPIFDEPAAATLPPPAVAVVRGRHRPPGASAAAVTAALEARGVTCTTVDGRRRSPPASRGAADALAATVERAGPLDAVVVALAGAAAGDRVDERVGAGARRARRHRRAASTPTPAGPGPSPTTPPRADRPVRLVTLTDATTAGGRSRAQAAAQLARAARGATGDRVAAFAVSVEAPRPATAGRSASSRPTCCAAPRPAALSGAELVAGAGWFGLRSHPRPSGSVTFGGPGVPDWLDDALREIVGARPRRPDDRRARPGSSMPTCTCGIRPAPTGTRTCRAAAAGHGRRHGDGAPLRRAHLPGRVGRVERREARERGRRDRPPLDRRDARARPPGRGRRPPRCHRRRHPADRLGGRGRRAARPADGGVPLPGRPPDGRVRRAAPGRRRAPRPAGAGPAVRADGPPRPARRPRPPGSPAFDDLVVVVEHTGWPRSSADEERALWKAGMEALAGLGDNVVCKLSGLAMPLGSMSADAFAPWIEHAIEAFGVDRCMFASNFPVDGMHGTLDELYTTFAAVTAGLDDESRDKLFATNAERVYRC